MFNPAKRTRQRKKRGPGSWVKLPGDPRLKRDKQVSEWQKARQALADAGALDIKDLRGESPSEAPLRAIKSLGKDANEF